jgi:hypothetical protein
MHCTRRCIAGGYRSGKVADHSFAMFMPLFFMSTVFQMTHGWIRYHGLYAHCEDTTISNRELQPESPHLHPSPLRYTPVSTVLNNFSEVPAFDSLLRKPAIQVTPCGSLLLAPAGRTNLATSYTNFARSQLAQAAKSTRFNATELVSFGMPPFIVLS